MTTIATQPQTPSPAGVGRAATLNAGHPVAAFLNRFVSAPPNARIAMAVGELATAIDGGAGDRSVAVAVSAIESGRRLGETAVALTALWGRWGRPTALIDLGTGSDSLAGALTSTSPDLASLAPSGSSADANGVATPARLHAGVPAAGVVAAGNADVLGLLSTGRLKNLIAALSRNHERLVVAAPPLTTGFPFLALSGYCDRLVLALQRGSSRGAPLREIAEQSLRLGGPPIDVIWFD